MTLPFDRVYKAIKRCILIWENDDKKKRIKCMEVVWLVDDRCVEGEWVFESWGHTSLSLTSFSAIN